MLAPVPDDAFDQAVIERQRHHIEAEIGRALHVGVAAEDVGSGAGRADIAGGEEQRAECAHVGGADGVLGGAHAPDQGRRLLRREGGGDPLELRRRNAGDTLGLFRRPLLDRLADIVHAVDALLDKLLVLEALLEDDVQHAPGQRNIGARTHADIFGRMRGGAGHARIAHDHVRAVHLLAFENVLERDRMRLRGIRADEQDRLRITDVGVGIGHRAVAPGIGHARDGRRMADPRLVIDVVGSHEGRQLAEQIGAFVGEFRRTEPVDRVRSVLGADGFDLVADLVDRGLPGDARPLSVDQLQRIFQPAIAMHEFACRRALRTMRSAADRRIPAGLLPDPHAVLHFTDDGAADRAMRADILADGDRRPTRLTGRGRCSIGLAHAGKRHGADSGQAAGHEPRTAQEGAAVDPAGGMT